MQSYNHPGIKLLSLLCSQVYPSPQLGVHPTMPTPSMSRTPNSAPPVPDPATQASRAHLRPTSHKRPRSASLPHLSHPVSHPAGDRAPATARFHPRACFLPNVSRCMATISLPPSPHLSPRNHKRYSNPPSTPCRPSRQNRPHWLLRLPRESPSIPLPYHYPWSVLLPSPLNPLLPRPHLPSIRRRSISHSQFPHRKLENVSKS